jgi:hypothetical protein
MGVGGYHKNVIRFQPPRSIKSASTLTSVPGRMRRSLLAVTTLRGSMLVRRADELRWRG